MTNTRKIEKFVKSLYKDKDSMHNLSHIRRIKQKTNLLKKDYKLVDKDLLNFLIYFHGLKKWVKNHKTKVLGLGFTTKHIRSLIRKTDAPIKKEEKIVCDANMLENVGNFGIKKAKILAREFNQTPKETLSLAKKFQKKYKFYTKTGKTLGKKGLAIKKKWIDKMESKLK